LHPPLQNGEVANKIASITRHVRNLQRKKFSFAGKSEPVKSDVEYDQLKGNLVSTFLELRSPPLIELLL
jgi:hypothetical protein